MKQLILITLMALATGVHAQSRIGYSLQEIRKEFSSKPQETGRFDDGSPYLVVTMERASVMYLLNSKNVCIATAILPNDRGSLNWYVERYNREAVILSDRKWRLYGDGWILDCELFDHEGKFYFLWTDRK